MRDEPMAYGARFPGKPGYGAVCVDLPDRAKETAKDIAGWIRRGASIERVTIEQARAGIAEFFASNTQGPTLNATTK